MKKVLELHRSLDKALSSVIIQMRTGRIGLHDYSRNVPDISSPNCICSLKTQTIPHILLACPLFKDLQKHIWTDGSGRTRQIADTKTILNSPALSGTRIEGCK